VSVCMIGNERRPGRILVTEKRMGHLGFWCRYKIDLKNTRDTAVVLIPTLNIVFGILR